MLIERPGGSRGEVRTDWLHSRHTFSFGHYHDPAWMGFGPLRVINEDIVAPGGGFAPHRHANMEILSIVLSGSLAHRDSTGNSGVIRPGEVQWMSAGHGIEHSEYNGSDSEPVHFLQVWIQPDRLNAEPTYDQQHFPTGARHGRWTVLASPEGREGGLPIRQAARLLATRLEYGAAIDAALDAGRRTWLHVATGSVDVDGRLLHGGDALGMAERDGALPLRGAGTGAADVLLFDLPA